MISNDAENILDHYQNPRNYGQLNDPDFLLEGYNNICGDQVKLYLKIEGNRITDVRFMGDGCIISMAATSILSETIQGISVDELKLLDDDKFLEIFGIELTPLKLSCALLAIKTVKQGIIGSSW